MWPSAPCCACPLSHGECTATDWSIDRLNNDGAYAPSNLAVISTQANRAKGARSFDEVHALSQRCCATDGLEPQHWLRLAALMLGPCFAPAPQRAPVIASPVPIPKFTVRLAMQQVQHVFASRAARAAGKNELVKHFRAASTCDRSFGRLGLLADAVHAGLKNVERPWDVWLQSGVMDRLLDWRQTLDEPSWAMAGAISCRLAGARQVDAAVLQAWNLPTRGYCR